MTRRRRGKPNKLPTPANDLGENGPTPERQAKNEFRKGGSRVEGTFGAVRVVPVIVSLHRRGLINDEQFAALHYFRDQASLADRSPVKSCLDFTPGGGHGPGIAIQSAIRETWRIERDLGSLAAVTRAVCVDDVPIEMHGDDPAMVLLELKFAAGRIVR